jgi:putative DNA primase/helicase
MPVKARAEAAKAGVNTGHIRTFHRIWATVRELLEREDDVVSGRLYLADAQTDHGRVRVVRTRGVRAITEQFEVPTMLLDATLPAKSILQVWFPDVTIVGQIEVPMSRQTTVKQVLNAPVAEKKILRPRNLRAVRRYVLQEWIKTGRSSAVVIMQMDPETALRKTGLPPEIATEHFNAIEGIDQYKDVRLLMVIGRTQPGPEAIEADAGALSGVEPATVMTTGRWFDKVTRGIRLRDGTGVTVVCDQHPDELAEAVRWQVCEGGVIQAVGRARGINRTDETPLDIAIVNDVVLPITVDVVEEWEAPGLEVEMAAEGIWLESPADMSKAWPEDWPTEMAAKNWLRENTVLFPYSNTDSIGKLHRARYQHPGAGQKWRLAWIDPAIIPDGRAWLESRFGIQLAGYVVTTFCVVLKAEDFNVGGLDWGTPPVLTVRPGPRQALEAFLTPEEVTAFWTLPPVFDARLTQHFETGTNLPPWSTPVVEEVTDPALVRQIRAECAEQEALGFHRVDGGEGAVSSPGGDRRGGPQI